ncbi:MAG: GTP-binding protein TypA [Candidatus Sungbacteria bacterium RIFCSPLOWO2_02_FULL_47_9]|uniref:50S ribosomal subunit assembly factor BipA n=1 Tax=Candidatus Sungbacteria bacterium RIFCSPHIGHO2_01_FULL_47_32 TaxID=1802264 RepID=A0A1G2K201_9BACT|nr:MAG: GTP-binding protein TypA [Candidatus Sungbacteria bacterium RIFCSPHIGHO2_01_FULL_47_32]OHA05034.1 MAG: GTP-binding protein TypA [Candidatus Sungbacteria bacterium RIFCSPLOWO2_01_FULL_47_32]OHA11853.1 MAG: GTP-binding protein TypA [Candidatus Sungbacteria bacterium RIFCSPLOWO2_02_FULL_47_9]
MNIRNVAIIAHVDHGKTTLVDSLLRQSKTKLSKEMATQEFIMDSNDLERERGITIFSKNASVDWEGAKINIIDTPGHADFGGEVERVLTMADGCLLLVDAKEGPMPQTRFVLKKALAMKHRIIVVINKIDKPDARPDFVLDKTFDLFMELGADDALADFPVIYASAKQGKAGLTPNLNLMTDISPVFDAILKHVPAPKVDESKPLQMLISTIGGDEFKGRIATGRIYNGVLRAGQDVAHISRTGVIKKYRLPSVMIFTGLERLDAKEAHAGDIAAISGIPDITIGETIADTENPTALPLLKIEEPTVKMNISVNDSPFCGKEATFSTSRQIRERLYRELETDMALSVVDGPNSDWIVSGRGELHLAILIERLRREGYEFQVSRPQVITKEVNGKTMTPYEEAFIEVPEAHTGAIIQKLGSRHGELKSMRTENGISFMEFLIPTRGLLGYRSAFLTDTKGLGIMNSTFDKYREDPGGWKEREQGSLVAHESGTTNQYGLVNLQDRGVLFFGPAVEVYKGQVVGQHSRSNDLRINVCKEKELSNMRARNDAAAEHFNTPKTMGLEDALEYIGDDELVEVTPKSVRIRKMILDESDYKRKQALGLIPK